MLMPLFYLASYGEDQNHKAATKGEDIKRLRQTAQRH